MQNSYWTKFAVNYDCNAYGSGEYNNTTCSTASTSGGGLSNTGEAFVPALAGGVLLITVAAAVLVRLVYKKRKSSQS